MRGLLEHFLKERRRLPLLGLCAFVSGYALYAHIGALAFGMPFPVFAGTIYAVAVVVAAAFTSYILPGLRRLTDAIAVSRLVFALWVVTAQGQDLAGSPMLSATIVVVGAMILMRGALWADRICDLSVMPLQFARAATRARGALDWIDCAEPRPIARGAAATG